MDEQISQLFVKELQNIVQNKPMREEFKAIDFSIDSINDLREGFTYLSTSLLEAQNFLLAICRGNLKNASLSPYNFLAGPLKEIQSILNHLTWQTIQVANGDYNQHIDYLGDFSTHFNTMIQQLGDREKLLKNQASALSQALSLFKLIANVQDNWILVLDVKTKKFIYANDSAKIFFFDPDREKSGCRRHCPLLDKLILFSDSTEHFTFEYHCASAMTYILIKGFPSLLDNNETIVYYLKDITIEKEKKELLEDIAYRDPLTHIYNRRYFIEYIDKITADQKSYSIISIDIDGLKYVNDTFGHIVGDDYLCTVVAVIQKYIRNSDVFCRFGGDEFILVLPNCSEEIALQKMEQINKTLKGLTKDYPLSLSYGGMYVPDENTIPLNEILNLIDEKMYLYKKLHKAPRPE